MSSGGRVEEGGQQTTNSATPVGQVEGTKQGSGTARIQGLLRRGRPTPEMVAAVVGDFPAERDAIIVLCMQTLGNGFVQQVVRAQPNKPAVQQRESASPIAESGVASANDPLPHHAAIQDSFGSHDISHVKTQTGGAATLAAQHLGASAFATGSKIAFAESPDLHTAAHEAAHVVQQQAGVHLKGGTDAGGGDPNEQHADAVADKVVKGESAEALLDAVGPKRSSAVSGAPVQRKEDHKPPSAAQLHKMLQLYLHVNDTATWRTVGEHFLSTTFPVPHPRLTWVNENAFVVKLLKQLETQIQNFDPLLKLDEIIYPATALKSLGGLLPTTEQWSIEMGLAVAHALHLAVAGSIHRVAGSYIALADSLGVVGPGRIDSTAIITSMPVDRYVASAMCVDQAVTLAPPDPKAVKPLNGKPVALRKIELTWQSGDLWNFVKANPADATAEEVAASLWMVTDDHGDNHASFNAYLLAAAPPLFGVPKRFAIKNPKATVPHGVSLEDDSVDNQLLAVASSRSADEATLQEKSSTSSAAPPTAADAKKAQSPAYAKLEAEMTDCSLQLDFANVAVTPWGLAPRLAPAEAFIKRKGAELPHSDPKNLEGWLLALRGQKERLVRIVGAINDLTESAKKLGIKNPRGPEATPARDILDLLAVAGGISHLAQPSEAKLQEGLRLQATLGVRALQATEGEMMGAIADVHARGGDNKYTSALSHDAGELQERSRILQSQMLNGTEVDPDELDDVSLKSDEITLESRMFGAQEQIGHLNNAAIAAGKGDAAIIASLFSGRFRDLPALSKHIFDEIQPIMSNLRSNRIAFDEEAKAGGTPERKKQQREARHKVLNDSKAKYDKISQEEEVKSFFETAPTTIQNQQFRTAVVQVAAMIGVSLVGGAVAGIAARAVGGVLLEASGAAAVADLSVAARTGIQAARVVTQIGVDTTINAAGAAAIQGRDFSEAWQENLVMALASTALFGTISHVAAQTAKQEAEAALREGRTLAEAPTWAKASAAGRAKIAAKEVGTITAHTLWGAAIGAVAGHIVTGKDQPPPESLREWALQGVSVAIGRHVQERLISHAEWYQSLEQKAEDGGRSLTATAKKMGSLAKAVIANKSPSQAVDLLAAHDEFLREEIQLIDRAIARGGGPKLQEERANLELAAAAAGDEGMMATKMVLLGMEELVPGALWKGTKDQIERAVASQTKPPPKVTREGKRWRVQLGDERVIEIQEVVSAEKTVDVERVVLGGQDEELKLAAKLVPPLADTLDVVIHGTVDDFVLNDVTIDHRTVAKAIDKSGIAYDRIRLLACKSGMHPKGAAQQLANKLGVPVLAPVDKLWIHPDGHMSVGPSESRDLGAAGWKEFKPQKSESRFKKAPEPSNTTKADTTPGPKPRSMGAKRLGPDDEEQQPSAGAKFKAMRDHLTDGERAAYEKIKGARTDAEVEQTFNDDPDSALKAIRARAAQTSKDERLTVQSKEKAEKIEAFVKEKKILNTKAAVDIISELPESPSNSEILEAARQLRTVVVGQMEVERNQAKFPDAEILTEVKVWQERLPGDDAVSGGLTQRNGVTYRDITDIDLLAVTPGPNGKKIIRFEQQKAGQKDTNADASGQNEKAIQAIAAARAGKRRLILEANKRDITQTLDLASADHAEKVTVGPAGKNFDESLEVTASDLERLMKKIVSENKKGSK
jgi:hypothetical protein